ncbi:hypothetical protein C2U72_00070 [Prosthecomicrobium hirschii]|uniref:hypothetical protein n=1 Tax=Prosthecodimorpha hirschii TaxID=665126 RepID=UPI00112BE06D|nr:hypothetical protein [Prosthecomicrobium hirschii]TPQ53055.1 hypothetical protein C2U72_00070 [Prosthecomicrobium hirschii]
MTERPSILHQIAELRREAMLREKTYPRLVAKHEMRQAEADYQLEGIWAAVATLEWCARNADLIRRVADEIRAEAADQTGELGVP